MSLFSLEMNLWHDQNRLSNMGDESKSTDEGNEPSNLWESRAKSYPCPFPWFSIFPIRSFEQFRKLRMSTIGIDPLIKICANSESKYIHAPPDLAKWNPIDIYLNWKRPFFSSSHSPALSFRASQNCHVSCTAFVSIFGAYTFSTIGRTGWKPFSGNDSDIWHCQVKANFQWCGKGVQTLKYIFFSKDSYQMYTAIDPIKRNLLSF